MRFKCSDLQYVWCISFHPPHPRPSQDVESCYCLFCFVFLRFCDHYICLSLSGIGASCLLSIHVSAWYMLFKLRVIINGCISYST